MITAFGFLAVFCMMLFDTLERYHPIWTLALAVACFAGATYATIIGSWPFAVVEAIWGMLKIYHYCSDPRRHRG